jgi:hypothetical protein
MQPADIAIETAESGTSLGGGFWAGWTAGMAATLGAFGGAIYLFLQSGSPGGPMAGGVIVVAFTLALIGIANIPNSVRRKRGFGERMRPAYRRYMWRFLPAMFAYVFLLMAAVSYANSAEPTGVVAWAVAIAPAIPILFAIRAIFLLPREEDDEYQRDRINRAYAWATGATLMVCTTVGFLDMFGVVPHLELWVIFPMWAILMGLARCLPLGGAR